MNRRLRLDLPMLLPDVPDAQDACVARLNALLERKGGIVEAHTVDADGGAPVLCLHYDPDVLSLAQVERLARGRHRGERPLRPRRVLAVYSIRPDSPAVSLRECQDPGADGVNGQHRR
jgi:hypothetical protein